MNHDYPVIVLFRSKDDISSEKVEQRLKKALIRSKGEFKLCIIDTDIINKQVTKSFNIEHTP